MPITRVQAREVARRFLSVFGFAPTESEDTIIEWNVVLNSNLMTTGETPQNFARRLLIMVARQFFNDDSFVIAASTWNKHLNKLDDGEGNKNETIGQFIDFLVEVL